MIPMSERTAVIGAGPAGLASAHAYSELNLDTTLFEKASDLGGLWRSDGNGPMWAGMRANLSKASCQFSTFSHRSTTSLFPSVAEMNEYLHSYARVGDLLKKARFGTTVQGVHFNGSTWQVGFCDEKGKQYEETFDGILIGSGYFSKGVLPELPGINDFTGEVLHSQNYGDRETYRDKRVIVVGNGLSGVEISADLVGCAKEVIHITRKPCWIIPRPCRAGPWKA